MTDIFSDALCFFAKVHNIRCVVSASHRIRKGDTGDSTTTIHATHKTLLGILSLGDLPKLSIVDFE